MTSGSFATVPLSSIIINRAERQRRVLDEQHINALSDSIHKSGLIHPPVIQRSLELVVGECRVAACRRLGWTNIPIQYIDELDPAALRVVELEENIRRKAVEWKDECLAVKELHDMHRAEDPTWSETDTGKTLGFSQVSISERLTVARELLNGNQRVMEAPRLSTARGIVSRAASRAKTAASVALTEAINPPTKASPIITADFREWAKTYTGPKFNFIHCDFPYGIGADKFVQGAAPTHGGYDDSEQLYWQLCSTLGNFIEHHCEESCHVMFWFSMHYYHATKLFFSMNCDLLFDPFPLVWLKSDNVGIIPDPQRGPRRIYETAFFGSRGDRKIVSPVANAIALPSERSEHMSIKSIPVLSHFFRMFTDSSTTFLDPTCGSGSSLRAAKAAGAKSVTGLEINEEFANRARLQMKATQ
jgi:ParB-like chromosome segregation protein Spo0J